MIQGTKISFCAPVRNEEFFIPLYLRGAVLAGADEIVLIDGGSSDGTLDKIKEFDDCPVVLDVAPQTGRPYSEDWQESLVRNRLLDMCTGDIVFVLDADEQIDLKVAEHVVRTLTDGGMTIVLLRLVAFWGDLHHIRVGTPEDPRWTDSVHVRALVRDTWVYSKHAHHCVLGVPGRLGDGDPRRVLQFPDVFYHLHYGFGSAGIKYRDNRRGDLGDPDAMDAGTAEPDFNYGNSIEAVKVQEYAGPWPEAVSGYL